MSSGQNHHHSVGAGAGSGLQPPPGNVSLTTSNLPMTGTTGKPSKGPRRNSGGTNKHGKNHLHNGGGGGRGSAAMSHASTVASASSMNLMNNNKGIGSSAATAGSVSVAGANSASTAATAGAAIGTAGPGGAGAAVGVSSSSSKDPNNKDESKENKEHHSRSYPRGVGLDFRKLAGLTLLNYIDHHGVPVRPEAPPSELAVAVARHFEAMEIDEEECIGGFLERLEVGVGSTSGKTSQTEYSRNTGFFDGYQMPLTVRKRQRSKLAARPGEQVAAKVTRTDENGSWILASVQRFYNDTETYDVQDEDDTSKLIRLPWNHVMRLSLGGEGVFNKGTDCMAIFPETTSFYRAKISKQPVWKIDPKNNVPIVQEMIVKFEDDEDDTTGKTPHRRVPARYVIPLPHIYFYDELDDVDLSLALPNGINPNLLAGNIKDNGNANNFAKSNNLVTSGTAVAGGGKSAEMVSAK